MKPMDLSGLIKGLMVVIGIAMALGKLNALVRWAAQEAFGGRSNHSSKTPLSRHLSHPSFPKQRTCDGNNLDCLGTSAARES